MACGEGVGACVAVCAGEVTGCCAGVAAFALGRAVSANAPNITMPQTSVAPINMPSPTSITLPPRGGRRRRIGVVGWSGEAGAQRGGKPAGRGCA